MCVVGCSHVLVGVFLNSSSWGGRVGLCVGGSIDGWIFVTVCVQVCVGIGVYMSVTLHGGSCVGGGT